MELRTFRVRDAKRSLADAYSEFPHDRREVMHRGPIFFFLKLALDPTRATFGERAISAIVSFYPYFTS